MSNHTPGPWYVNDDLVWSEHSLDEVAVVIRVYQQDEEFEANARLIAAAPKMLASIKLAADLIRAANPKSAMMILDEMYAEAKGEMG